MELVGTAMGRRVLGGWEYDAEGNVLRTWKGDTVAGPTGDAPGPDAVELYSLSYDDPADPTETAVTGPLGEVTVYTIERDPASPKARISGWSGDWPPMRRLALRQLRLRHRPPAAARTLDRRPGGVDAQGLTVTRAVDAADRVTGIS